MKFINSKTAKNYISEIYQPKEWGGLDDYELKFIPEKEQADDELLLLNNNNKPLLLQQNLNLTLENKKVIYFRKILQLKKSLRYVFYMTVNLIFFTCAIQIKILT